MSRTPNDDRSDAMNPNNEAYDADQENRYGSGDDYWDGDGAVAREKRASPSDTRFGPDPHPILGRRSNRLPSLSRNFEGSSDSRPSVPEVVPFHETLALAFATEQSEARDRALASEEMMKVADWILTTAREIILRQGNETTFEKGRDGEDSTLTLTCRSHRLVVRTLREFEVVLVEQENSTHAWSAAFRFGKLRWHTASPRFLEGRGSDDWKRSKQELEDARRRDEKAGRQPNKIVGYDVQRDPERNRAAQPDPAQHIHDVVKGWGAR